MSNAYDAVAYPTSAQARLHIENLYLCARLNGYSPVAVERARVLEIGCGTGFNLIPMAAEFPEGDYLGLDYAESAIRAGNDVITELGLQNIHLVCVDLRQATADVGTFDYIIVHGFYSWVPDAVRAAMWALVKQCLSPRGILHVSYNALPGWYSSCMVRDLAKLLANDGANPADAVERIWDVLGVFARHEESNHPIALEAARIRRGSKAIFYHDELAPDCQPFYLREVVDHAEHAGLRYVSEAHLYIPPGLQQKPDVGQLLMQLAPEDLKMRRQLLDFAATRRFHDSLFAHAGHETARVKNADTLKGCWGRSDIRLVEEQADGQRVYEHSWGVRMQSAHPVLCKFAGALEAAAPGSIPLGDYLSAEIGGAHEPAQSQQFWELVMHLLEARALMLRINEVKVARTLVERPRALPFTRVQMRYSRDATNCYHESSNVPEAWQRMLMTLLDGTRDPEHLAEELAARSWTEILAENGGGPPVDRPFGISDCATFREDPSKLSSRENLRSYYQAAIPEALNAFLRGGFLAA